MHRSHRIHACIDRITCIDLLRSHRIHVCIDSVTCNSRVLTAFRAAGGLYQWTRLCDGLLWSMITSRSSRTTCSHYVLQQQPASPARRQRHEDAHSTGAQVATENLSQDFPKLFPALSWLDFPLAFSEWNLTYLRGPYFACHPELIHPPSHSVHTCLIVWPISKRRGVLWHCST